MDPLWTPEAQDCANIFDYIEADNPATSRHTGGARPPGKKQETLDG